MRVTNVLSAVASTYRDGKPGATTSQNTPLESFLSRGVFAALEGAFVRSPHRDPYVHGGENLSMENRDDMAIEILEVNEQMAILNMRRLLQVGAPAGYSSTAGVPGLSHRNGQTPEGVSK